MTNRAITSAAIFILDTRGRTTSNYKCDENVLDPLEGMPVLYYKQSALLMSS